MTKTQQETEKLVEDIKRIRKEIEGHVSAYSKSELTEEQESKVYRFNNIWESHNNSYDRALNWRRKEKAKNIC